MTQRYCDKAFHSDDGNRGVSPATAAPGATTATIDAGNANQSLGVFRQYCEREPRITHDSRLIPSTLPAIERFMSGDTSAETLADLRYAVTRWIMSDGTLGLHRVLQLGTPRSARLRLRDALLRDAARLLDGSAWDKARALVETARLVSVRRSHWHRSGVPDTADAVERLVFEASRLDRIDLTIVQMRNIIHAESE